MFLYVLLGVLVVGVLWVVSEYNFFASAKTRIGASIQEIGNQLKRQADLIPNLEESAKGYLKHEKGIYKDLTDARRAVASAVESGDINKMAEAGNKVNQVLPALKIAVESNPELKGSEVVGKLMEELRDTSDKVMYSRRLLIDLTVDYNVKRVTFPSSVIANSFGFGEMAGLKTPPEGAHLEVTEGETKSPKVQL